MKKWFLISLFVAIALNIQPALAGMTVTDVEIIDYGIMSAKVAKTIKDQTLVQGAHHSMLAGKFKKRTTEIPAQKGLKFGITYLIKGYPIGSKVKVDFTVLYPQPGLTNPATGKTDNQSMLQLVKKIGRITATGYVFNQKWEMVPGKWTFQIWIEGRLLAEKNFNVYLPPSEENAEK